MGVAVQGVKQCCCLVNSTDSDSLDAYLAEMEELQCVCRLGSRSAFVGSEGDGDSCRLRCSWCRQCERTVGIGCYVDSIAILIDSGQSYSSVLGSNIQCRCSGGIIDRQLAEPVG